MFDENQRTKELNGSNNFKRSILLLVIFSDNSLTCLFVVVVVFFYVNIYADFLKLSLEKYR